MISQRRLEREYKKLLHQVETDEFYNIDLTNRVNCYICTSCKHVTKTRDVAAGVTPFMNECVYCGDMAQSTMYKDIKPHCIPTLEWYRPSLEECMRMRNKRPAELEHILKGGLISRVIQLEKRYTDHDMIAFAKFFQGWKNEARNKGRMSSYQMALNEWNDLPF